MSTVDLHSIARTHGGEVWDGGRRWIGPGPGHNRKDRSLSVVIGDGGKPIVHSFSSRTTWQEGAKHLGIEGATDTSGLSSRERERLRAERERADRKRRADRLAYCATIWQASQPAEGTAAETYLKARGIAGQIPGVLRFHPAAPFGYSAALSGKAEEPTPRPCMIALAQDASGKPTGLHLTALPAQWKPGAQTRRIMLGSTLGTAVRLFDVGDDRELAVGEGLETCLAFSMLNGVPCWSALSTAMLKSFDLPKGLKRLLIAADGDNAGMAAATELAERASKSCDVMIVPASPGRDWNDELRGGQ